MDIGTRVWRSAASGAAGVRWGLLALLFTACTALWPLLACAQTPPPADPPGRVGRLADLKGGVWLFDAEQGAWAAAVRNRPLTSGDRLATDAGSQAEVRIGSTVLRLGAGSEVQLLQLDDERLRVQLSVGSLALRLRTDENAAEAELLTPEGRLLPERAGHYRLDRHRERSLAAVLSDAPSGEATLDLGAYIVPLAAGQASEFWLEGRDPDRRVARSTGALLPDDAFAAWVAAAERRESAIALQPFVSPEMTGIEDLDSYGRWDTHPEFGPLWVPVAVAPGWAPYRDGRWVFVPPWGWTWVDAAPWGFAPFHYGRWVSWQGRWCWAPGPYVRRPVYAPALVVWVGEPGRHRDEGFPGRRPLPGATWVPLAPRETYRPHFAASPIYIERINGRAALPPSRYEFWLRQGGRVGDERRPGGDRFDRGERPEPPGRPTPPVRSEPRPEQRLEPRPEPRPEPRLEPQPNRRPDSAWQPNAPTPTPVQARPNPQPGPVPSTRAAGADAPERAERNLQPGRGLEIGSPHEPFRDGRVRPPAAEPGRAGPPAPAPVPPPPAAPAPRAPAAPPGSQAPGINPPPPAPLPPKPPAPPAPPAPAERPAPPKAEPPSPREAAREPAREPAREREGRAQVPEARGPRARQEAQ